MPKINKKGSEKPTCIYFYQWYYIYDCTTSTERPVDNLNEQLIDHPTVLCSMNWPLNGSKAGGEMFSMQTSSCSNAN